MRGEDACSHRPRAGIGGSSWEGLKRFTGDKASLPQLLLPGRKCREERDLRQDVERLQGRLPWDHLCTQINTQVIFLV